MKRKSYFRTMLLVLCLSICWCVSAWASTKTISSVTIRVSSGLDAGDTLPDISYGSSDSNVSNGEVIVSVSGSKYEITDAKWVTSTSHEVKVGDSPEMKVWLSPINDDEYQFKGTYHSSNVSIKSGTFVKANKSSGSLIVWLKIKPVKGDFDAPSDAYWKDNAKGTAKWDAPDDNGTGKYEVVLKRGSSTVTTVETSSRNYNFYPYMSSAGTYTFRVRTIAKTSKEADYGKKSEWTDSDEIYLAKEDVYTGAAPGSGSGNSQSSNTAAAPGGTSQSGSQVGWVQSDGGWYFRYPDGTYQKNGWSKFNDKWYLFDASGRVLTGWQKRNGYYYYLGNDGVMRTGWVQENGKWYYLNPYPDQYQGCMFADMPGVIDGNEYYFGSDGARIEGWKQIQGNWCYYYPGTGIKAKNTWIDYFYLDENGNWRK